MFYKIEEALEVVMSRKNMTYGIELFQKCLNDMGNPEKHLKVIHIGGTNGKGSTTNFVRSILQEEGKRVGTFTSPHLITHNDRIRINNKPISDSDLLMYINITEPFWDTYQLSMFEIDMLISILYFNDQSPDCVIYEVGLGGRLDATNVIKPNVIGLTNVSFDHMNILGDTLPKIAFEKAGIIKTGVPVFTTEIKEDVISVFEEKCREEETVLNVITIPSYQRNEQLTDFVFDNRTYSLKYQGSYQVGNACLAISLVKAVYPGVSDQSLKDGILNARWAGRFERIAEGLYLDGAHNMAGIQALVQSMKGMPRPWIVVFTALSDKPYNAMIDCLAHHFDTVIITQFEFYRSEKAEMLARGHNVIIEKDYEKAIDDARNAAESGTCIVTGSLYFISEARKYLLK